MHKATFFLSTGRCGTQWLAHWLAEQYADKVNVEHEPLHNKYQSRSLLTEDAHLNSEVMEHLVRIDQVLQERPYIEVGHPCWGALPHLINHFQDRIRIVHLVRHPVTTSYSWTTHGAYQKPLLPHIPEKILLQPSDKGVFFPEYQQVWQQLATYEKSLYYWTEVNTLGLQLEQEGNVPWLRISYEDLFQGDDLKRLLTFLELSEPGQVLQTKKTVIDKFHYMASEWSDWNLISGHKECLLLAERLGYSLSDVDEHAMMQRYLGQ